MGQFTTGIFFGCVQPEEAHMREEDMLDGERPSERPGMIDLWEGLPKSRRGTLELDDPSLGDKVLVGFWIAVAGEGESAAEKATDISFKCVPWKKIQSSKRARSALAAWKHVEEIAAKMGVKLDSPEFWITPIEIA